ncbi:MAG: zf-HC2 domain-containing protein [Rhodocyclaceae bacterium]|jgi:hypothetical protein|nr:zf-HC2 domain-containing protein [Rhodocyclaceae bacterium]
MLNCKEAAELMSQALDRELGVGERLSLNLHLMFCAGCRNARHQLSFIRDACAAWFRQSD